MQIWIVKKERIQMNEITLMDVRLNELVTTGLVVFGQSLVAIRRLGVAYKIRQYRTRRQAFTSHVTKS